MGDTSSWCPLLKEPDANWCSRGKRGARSAKQAIAIGLSKARRAGVKLPPPSAKRKSR